MMKKMAALLLAIVLMFVFSTSGLAGAGDLTAMTTDELLELHKQLIAELRLRFAGATSTLYAGQYRVGVEIKQGSYLLSHADTENFMLVAVFPSSDELDEYLGWKSKNKLEETSISYIYLFPDDEVSISIKDTELLYVEDGNCQIFAVELPYAP